MKLTQKTILPNVSQPLNSNFQRKKIDTFFLLYHIPGKKKKKKIKRIIYQIFIFYLLLSSLEPYFNIILSQIFIYNYFNRRKTINI